MNPTLQNQNADYFNPGQGGNPMSSVVAPVVPTTINASQLGSTPTLKFPEQGNPMDSANSAYSSMSNFQPTVQTPESIISSTNQLGVAGQQNEQSRGRVKDLMSRLLGKSAAQIEQNKLAGKDIAKNNVDSISKQIFALNNEALDLRNQATNVPNQIQNQFEGTGATRGGVAPVQTAQLRNLAIKQGIVASQSLSLQSAYYAANQDLTNATDKADKAVAAIYDPIQERIDYEKGTIELNKDSFTKEEADRAAIRTAKLDEMSKNIAYARADKTSAISLMGAALSNYPNDLAVQLAIAKANKVDMNSPDALLKVTGLLSKYQKDPNAVLKDALSIQLQRAQIAQIPLENRFKQAQIDNLNAETKKKLADIDVNPIKLIQNADVATPEGRNTSNLITILGSKKIAEGAKTQVANVLGVINAVQDIASKRQNGKFKGLNPLQGIADFISPEALLSKEAVENRGYLDAINLKVQQWASGASLTAQQTEQVNNLTPKKSDTDGAVKTKLNNLTNFMLTQAKSSLQSQGVNFVPEKSDLFMTQDLIDGLSKEQQAELKAQGLL